MLMTNSGLLTLWEASQEGSSRSVVERLALDGKEAGGDHFHIGDAGFSGSLHPSYYSLIDRLRGKRHTYRRMVSRFYVE